MNKRQIITVSLLFLGFFLLGFIFGLSLPKETNAQVVGTVPTITNCVTGPSGYNNIQACTVTDQWGVSHLVVIAPNGGVAIAGGKQ
jgi:hypothetical protein